MPGYVIEILQTKGKESIWSQSLKVAAYCRVSTDHEAQKQSLENQIAFYTDYVRRNPYWKLVAVYADNSSGLRAKNRPGYQRLLKDCNQFDTCKVPQPLRPGHRKPSLRSGG